MVYICVVGGELRHYQKLWKATRLTEVTERHVSLNSNDVKCLHRVVDTVEVGYHGPGGTGTMVSEVGHHVGPAVRFNNH